MKRSMFSLVFVVGLLLICAGSASASWAPGYIHGTIWGGKSIDIAGYIVEQIPGNKIKITINPDSSIKCQLPFKLCTLPQKGDHLISFFHAVEPLFQ